MDSCRCFFNDGSHLVKVFDLVASFSLLRCVNLTLEFEPIHKDQSIWVSRHSVKDYVLFAYRDGGEAAIFNAKGGVASITLKAQHPAASIQATEGNHSHWTLQHSIYPVPARSYLGLQPGLHFTGHHHRGRIPHCGPLSQTPHSTTTEIIIWNLETEDHKHIARFPGLLAHGVCSDLQYCVGFCPGEAILTPVEPGIQNKWPHTHIQRAQSTQRWHSGDCNHAEIAKVQSPLNSSHMATLFAVYNCKHNELAWDIFEDQNFYSIFCA